MSQDSKRNIVSVSELTSDLKCLLEDNFASVWVSGEVSNFTLASSGHAYFSLKDENSQISSVIFRMNLNRIKFKLEDGLALVVHGRLSVYSPRGQYQIIIDHAEPQGLGSLQLAFEQLKKDLEKRGYFNEDHKKDLPFLPQRIALITSGKGAAIHDLQNVLTRRYPNINILLCPVTVQGENAKHEISEMIDRVNRRSDVDLIIVGRGGGSMEDLWAFNEEIVIESIFQSEIPIISAVGHETDFTLSDFVADLRAPTPSAAAELAVPEVEQLALNLSSLKLRLNRNISQEFHHYREEIERYISIFKKSESILGNYFQRLDDLNSKIKICLQYKLSESKKSVMAMRSKWFFLKNKLGDLKNRNREIQYQLSQNMKSQLQLFSHRYEMKGQRLKDLSPFLPLKRGYSLVKKIDSQELIRVGDQVKMGDDIEIHLSEDKIQAKITKLYPH